ncbi:thioredoxin domain-containing protein [bacterium]|nr:thioredoxin domain-containing protein [bacterium]
MINCLASWCAPCMDKMPELKEMSKGYANSLSVLGMDFDKNADDFLLSKNIIAAPWKQINAETSNGNHGDAWLEISRIWNLPRLYLPRLYLPRLYLLNPTGELSCDFNPIDFKDVLTRELKNS